MKYADMYRTVNVLKDMLYCYAIFCFKNVFLSNARNNDTYFQS